MYLTLDYFWNGFIVGCFLILAIIVVNLVIDTYDLWKGKRK